MDEKQKHIKTDIENTYDEKKTTQESSVNCNQCWPELSGERCFHFYEDVESYNTDNLQMNAW